MCWTRPYARPSPFFAGNLLSPDFLRSQNPYDAIFCRNLLIYFDRPTQSKALSKLERILTPTGFLFVGAAEQPLALEYGFVSANIPMAFACRRIAPVAPLTGAPAPGGWLPRAKAKPLWNATKPGPTRTFDLPRPGSRPAADQIEPSRPGGFVLAKASPQAAQKIEPGRLQLDEARRLADAGKLKEAAQLCEAYLRSHDTSAQGWYLLGLIRDAANEPDAMECYRKALYLEPNHYDTLLQMALLSEKNGERGRARTFRNRAVRVKARNGS
jgi:chemotaxis protein methyltransferase WspC